MKRPWYLTVWLVIIFLGAIFSLIGVAFGGNLVSNQYPNLPSWVMPVSALSSIVELVAVAMLWMWKMMGFYIIVVVAVIGTVVNLLYLGVGSAILGVVGVVILYLVMRPVWSNFR